MLYDKIKELLNEKKLTQRDMCKEIGITEQSFSGIKNGSKKAGIEMILKIAKYLNVHPLTIAPEYKELLSYDLVNSNIVDEVLNINKDCSSYNLTIALKSNNKLIESNEKLIDMNMETNTILVDLIRMIKEK